MKQHITAVVVTYNRLNLLKRNIDHIRRQTLPVDGIVVVNNGSTDGTHEWLDTQTDLTVVHQDNVGGAGGFYTGIKTAYESGAQWIWCMDDDVYPTENCLETLYSYTIGNEKLGVLCPRRLQAGKIVGGETLRFNHTNPLLPTHKFLPADYVGDKELVNIEGMAFEGPLISRKVVERIGYPNTDLFIFYDDSDYSYRAVLAGFDVVYCQKAILDKELFPPKKKDASSATSNWRRYYFVRNMSYFCREYGQTFASRWLGGIRFCVHEMWNSLHDHEYKDIMKFWNVFMDGKRKRLGRNY